MQKEITKTIPKIAWDAKKTLKKKIKRSKDRKNK